MKYFGFLSFGHYSNGGRRGIAAAESLHQAIDLSVAADEIGVNGAFFRVHHFVPQAAAPLHEQYPTQLNPGTPLPVLPHSPGLRSRIWYGAGSNASAVQAARDGVNLMNSTLVFEHGDKPFGDIQAEQLRAYRRAWAQAGHDAAPRVSVSRSIFPLLSERDRGLYGLSASGDQFGHLDSGVATFGRTYAADSSTLIKQLSQDRALAEANTLLLTIPNQLGFEENWSIIRNFADYVAPALGWEPARPGVLPTGYDIDETE